MCRALLYIGRPLLLERLLYGPDNALAQQTYMPQMLDMLNLAGFGMLAWDETSFEPSAPFAYHTTDLPVFDRNLANLSAKVEARCLLAHVRGVPLRPDIQPAPQNIHPFLYEDAPVALAHNGDLYGLANYRADITSHIAPERQAQIKGTTDSELVYALLLSQLPDGTARPGQAALEEATLRTLDIIARARRRAGVDISSSLNLFVTDGQAAMAIRYCFDFGRYRTEDPSKVHEANTEYLSLWYTVGDRFGLEDGEWRMIGGDDAPHAFIVASEPLTRDSTTWLEAPPYHLIYADLAGDRPRVECSEIRL